MEATKLGIKIEFDTDAGRPERVFKAMAVMTESINDIHQIVLDSAGLDLRLSPKLSRTLEGSVIGVQSQEIKSRTDNKTKSNLLERLMTATERFLGEPEAPPIVDDAPMKKVVDDYQSIIDDAIEVTPADELRKQCIDEYRIAKNYEKIIQARRDILLETDDVFLGDGETSESPGCLMNKERYFKVSVEDIYTKSEKFPHKNVVLAIVHPSFSGDTWKFKWLSKVKGRPEFSAKILHDEWLARWFQRELNILPGDGLRVDVDVFMNNKNRKDKLAEITLVHDVVPSEKMEQCKIDQCEQDD